MKRQEGRLESNQLNTGSNANTGTDFDQREQNVQGPQINVGGDVLIQMPLLALDRKSWHTVTGSNLRWLSRVFMAFGFIIVFVWFVSEFDLPRIKLSILTLDFSIIKPWLTSLGIRLGLQNMLASSISSGVFALLTWRLATSVTSSENRNNLYEGQIELQKLLPVVNASSLQLSSPYLLEERAMILDHVGSKLERFWERVDPQFAIEMEEVPEAIESAGERDWSLAQKAARRADITEIFAKHRSVLVLLGKPGAGKTTTLLKLWRHLYEEAKHDESSQVPVPVLLNLTSWATTRSTIENWLVDSLPIEYRFKRHHAKSMIENKAFIYLLDGLDEVPAAYRSQCVDAINTFSKQSLGPIVICCRSQEYHELSKKIAAFAAYQLLPLTDEQIEQYLLTAGPQADKVRRIIKDNEELRELARTPLMLSIMIRGVDAEIFTPRSKRTELHQQIFDQYIRSVVEFQGKHNSYSPTQVILWLRWQAKRMVEYHINTFYLEDIQPAWLVLNNQQHPLLRLASNLRFRKIVKSVLPFISKNRPGTKTVSPYTDISWRWGAAGTGIRTGFVTGFKLGCGTLVLLGLLLGILSGLALGIPGEFFLNIVNRILELLTKQSLVVTEILTSVVLTTSIIGALLGAISGFLLGVVFSGPVFGILNGLLGGVVAANITKMIRPSQSIQRSGIFGLIAGISIGAITTIGFGVITGMLTNSSLGRITGICLGTIVGTYAALTSGGTAFLAHYALRLLLYLNGDIPFRYVRFLEYACGRILLHRIGPGYIFIHRMLLEHFASLTDEDIKRITAEYRGLVQ